MSHLQDWTITAFERTGDHRLRLRFADGSGQEIDFLPVLGGWLQPLRDPAYFGQVRLNEAGNLEWPEGEDFNPEALHDWPRFEPLYREDARRTTPLRAA